MRIVQGRPEHTAVKAAVLILALAAVLFGQDEGADADETGWWHHDRLRIELFSYNVSVAHGASDWDGGQNGLDQWQGYSILGAHVEWEHFRVGTVVEEQPVGWYSSSYLPLKLGYTVWTRPVGYFWRFEGMAPEVSGELTLNWWNETGDEWGRVPIEVRVDAVIGADLLGAGLSVAAGVIYIQNLDGHSGEWVLHQGFSPSLEIRFRPGTFAIDMGRRTQS